jgi:hypothetical protein
MVRQAGWSRTSRLRRIGRAAKAAHASHNVAEACNAVWAGSHRARNAHRADVTNETKALIMNNAKSTYQLVGGEKYSADMIEAAVVAYRKALKARYTCAVLDAKAPDDVHCIERDAALQDLKKRERYAMGAARMEREEHHRQLDAKLAKESAGKRS